MSATGRFEAFPMTNHPSGQGSRPGASANKRLAAALFALTAVMVGLSFAAVPLYRLFCQATGYDGTPKRAEAASGRTLDREITVRFDANVSSALGWTFQPAQREMRLKIGENALAFYTVANTSSTALTGTATFNVTPEIAGSYFSKVECFCFTEQRLEPGQKADLPVSFFIDPTIVDDADAGGIQEITLSYTFFKANKPDASAASASGKGAASKPLDNAGSPG
jgi:cytochrome c oxidase assembly protein subunit 11